MEKAGKSVSDVVRRTAPIKVSIGLLYRELEGSKAAESVTLHRELLESILTTLECAVEDIELRAPKAEVRVVATDAARVAVNRS